MKSSKLAAAAPWVVGSVLAFAFGRFGLRNMLLVVPVMLIVVLATFYALALASLLRSRMRPDAPIRVAVADVDPTHRMLLEAQVHEVISGAPDWRLHGWLRMRDGDALVAGDGVSYLFAMRAANGAGCVAVSTRDTQLVRGTCLYPPKKFFTLSGMDPEDYALIGQPAYLLLRVHRAHTAGRPVIPVADPISYLIATWPDDFVRSNTKPGRRVDAAGNGAYTLLGALRALGRASVSDSRAARENARALALLAAAPGASGYESLSGAW